MKASLDEIRDRRRERPQNLFMRVSLCIHRDNIEKAFETLLLDCFRVHHL